MKKILLLLFILQSLSVLGGFSPFLQAASVVLETPATIPANTSTNLTPAALTLPAARSDGRTGMRLYLTFTGTAGATNGTVVVYLVTSLDGVTWDTATQSNIKLTAVPGGATQVQRSDQVQLAGAAQVGVGRIEVNSNGDVSNCVVRLGYQSNP